MNSEKRHEECTKAMTAIWYKDTEHWQSNIEASHSYLWEQLKFKSTSRIEEEKNCWNTQKTNA